MLVAQATKPLEVALGRREHAAGALHRLGDHRGDFGAALGHERGHRLEIVTRHLHDFGEERSVPLLVRRDALRRGAPVVDAVVAPGARDDQLALGMAGEEVSEPGQLHHGVDRLGARAGEEDAGVVHRADADESFGQLLGRLVGEGVERRIGGEGAGLLADGIGDLAPPVADRAVPETGHRIDQRPPRRVPDHGALAPHDRDELLTGGLGERMQEC